MNAFPIVAVGAVRKVDPGLVAFCYPILIDVVSHRAPPDVEPNYTIKALALAILPI